MGLTRRLFVRRMNRYGDLPTLPTIALSIGDLLRDPRSSVLEAAALIQRDQVLTSKLLRLVNSAFYGFPKRIMSLDRAVVILGFHKVRNVVLSVGLIECYRRHARREFDFSSFWEHSLAAAIAGDAMAQFLSLPDAEGAFVGGLLHDIGKLTLSIVFPGEYQRVLATLRDDRQRACTAEQARLEVDHADVGRWLAELWNFPPGLVEAIGAHHCPTHAFSNPMGAALLHVSSMFARALGFPSPEDDKVSLVEGDILLQLGLTREKLEQCIEQIVESLRQAGSFFELLREESP